MAHEINRQVSTSDDDSVSLLCSLDVCQARGAVKDMGVGDSDAPVRNEGQKKEVEVNQVQAPESEKPSCSQSTSQLASVKVPNKAQLRKRNGKGETLLHKACRKDDLAQARLLIQAGISINMEDYAGWTALHEASVVGDAALVSELLKAGANVNARSCDGITPLHDAVVCGHYQVVKILLQYGSNISDRNVGGLSALDLAEEENIRELLQASVRPGRPCGALAQHRQAGALSEAPCQRSFGHNDTAHTQARESGDGGGATEPADIQLRRKVGTTPNAITLLLEEMERKQTEISTWPLAGLEDTDRFHAALTHIQDVLTEALTKQHLEKDDVAQRQRTMPNCLQQRLLKGQIVSLASRQRTLVELLQKQMHLVETYVTAKAKLSTQPPNHPSRQQLGDLSTPASTLDPSEAGDALSSNQNRPSKRSHTRVTQASLLRSGPSNNAPLLKRGKKTPTHSDGGKESSAPRPGSTSQHMSFTRKRHNALIQSGAEDHSRHLRKLVQSGIVPPGSSLQLLWKGRRHLAHVQANGSIKDSKGRLHLAPKHWLESILGNNIPVSSSYASDKVTFRDKPLSYYLLNMEDAADRPQTRPEDSVQACSPGSSQEELLTAAAALQRLMNIKIIHLVNDEDLMPVTVLDYHWEKLLNDCSGSEDW